jgi:hypothetical protein
MTVTPRTIPLISSLARINLNRIAERLSTSWKLRHLFLIAAAFIAILLTGYHLGSWDQIVHLTFLKKFANPALYPGDPFPEIRLVHYSYFWFFFEPFYLWKILEPVLFFVHFLSVYLTFWALWELSNTLFKNPLANLLCVITFIAPHLGMTGFTVVEFNLLNKSFVLPFLLAAIILYLRKQVLIAFFILGLMYNLHVISVNFILAMFFFDILLSFKRIGWKNILLGVGLFIIGALPVIIWRSNSAPIDFSLRPETLSIEARGILWTVYYLFSPNIFYTLETLGGIAYIFFYIKAVRQNPSPENDPTMNHFMMAIGLVILVAVINSYWLPVTFILQFQLLRIGFFILLFSYIYFCHYLVRLYQTGKLNLNNFSVIYLSFASFISPLAPMFFWSIRSWFTHKINRQKFIVAAIFSVQVALIIGGFLTNVWIPGLQIYAPNTPWVDAQLWARDHTQQQARFITPPGMFDYYVPDWRVFSERSTVVSLPELMMVSVSPDYLPGWLQRFNTLAPGVVDQFNGDYPNNFKLSNEAFYTLTSDDLLRIAREYNTDYLVVEKPHLHNFPIAYENQQFIVYDVRSLK